MMKSEFIEKTGFEPTEAEYRGIEAEYMGCDIGKDEFCKTWKKQGGVQRLMRLRARRMSISKWIPSTATQLENLKKRLQNAKESLIT